MFLILCARQGRLKALRNISLIARLNALFTSEIITKGSLSPRPAQIEAKRGRFSLITLYREQEFIEGKLKSIDFLGEHSVIIQKGEA